MKNTTSEVVRDTQDCPCHQGSSRTEVVIQAHEWDGC